MTTLIILGIIATSSMRLREHRKICSGSDVPVVFEQKAKPHTKRGSFPEELDLSGRKDYK